MFELNPRSKNPLGEKQAGGIQTEEVANAWRLLDLLVGSNIPSSEWPELIESARQAGVLGSDKISDCLERMRAFNKEVNNGVEPRLNTK